MPAGNSGGYSFSVGKISRPATLRAVPIQVFPHLRFDDLLDAVAPALRRGIPVLQPVIVPSLPFSDHLQKRIAARFGISMGMEFILPQDFVHRAVGPGQDSVWNKAHLTWQVLDLLESVEGLPLDVGGLSRRERYSLAVEIADRFDQYGHYRPEMIRSWRLGVDPGGKSPDLLWQRQLWRAVRTGSGQMHPAEVHGKTDSQTEERLRMEFGEVLVIGSGMLDPLVVEVLLLLASIGCKVRVDVLLPSLGFLGDLRRQGIVLSGTEDVESLELESGHPLLVSMGRQAVGTFHLLSKMDEQFENWPEPVAIGANNQGSESLLQLMQKDVRGVRAPSRFVGAEPGIGVHGCFGPRREMEVLRDELLRAFEELPGLQPDEVHIVTPEPEIYAPLVQAVLNDLPVRLTEVAAGEMDAVLEMLGALLRLAARGRYEASELWELLELRATQEALAMEGDEADLLQSWIEECGVAHGLGQSTLGEPGTWRFSRDRLTAGIWMEAGAQDAEGRFVLPVPMIAPPELQEKFLTWWLSLEEIFREWENPVRPKDWAARLQSAVAELSIDPDTRVVQQAIGFLQNVGCDVVVDAGVISDWLDGHLQAGGRRTTLSGRISFGSMRQLQNLPCKVLAMAGLQGSAFPRQTRRPAWDLMQNQPRVWDRNVRIEDRQMFLDALLTAGDRLIITASNRNMMTGVEESFAAPVEELLRTAMAMGVPEERLVFSHPLQPFHPDYFNGTRRRSYSEFGVQTARQIATSERTMGYPLITNRNVDEEIQFQIPASVAGKELVKFWKNPAQQFLRRNKIATGEETRNVEELDRLVLNPDGLDSWKVSDRMWVEMLNGGARLEELRSELEASRLLPPGVLGDAWWAEKYEHLAALALAFRDLRGDEVELAAACGEWTVRDRLMESKDGSVYLHAVPGKMEKPKHFFGPWIQALVAACADRNKPVKILCEDQRTLTMPVLEVEIAREILSDLVRGFFAEELICFADATSEFLAKKLQPDCDEFLILQEAAKKWSQPPDDFSRGGDGFEESQALAWRDREPFCEEYRSHWIDWAERILQPLLTWMGGAE